MLAVSEMKRTNVNLEKLALWFITQKKNSSFRLLSLVNENHFGNKGNLAAFKRIKFVAKKRNEIMSWDDVLEDSAVPEAARLILQSFEKTTQVNTSRATEIYNRLEELRKKRVVFDGLKELVEEKLLKNVDIDEIVNTDLSNILTKARSPELDDEFFIIGRGGNSEEIVENVLSKGLHYIPTGFNAWDKQNGGFTCPGVVLLGAHTSSGKSQMADTLAENFVDQGAKTCVTSLEMDIEELTVKRLARATGINQGKILLNDELSENDKQKIRKTFNERQKRWDKENKALYTYVPKGNPTIEELLLRLQPKQFKIYIIDYITLLGDSGGDNQWRKLGEIVAYAKTFSRNNNCIVILLVQITQEQKLKYSQTMLEHADLAWFWVKDQTVIDTGIIQINTPKARKQKTITFPLKAEYEYARFADVPDDYKPPQPKDIINPELKNKVKIGGNKGKTKTGGDKLMDEYFPTKKKAA